MTTVCVLVLSAAPWRALEGQEGPAAPPCEGVSLGQAAKGALGSGPECQPPKESQASTAQRCSPLCLCSSFRHNQLCHVDSSPAWAAPGSQLAA